MKKKIKDLQYGDKIEMLSGFIRTVKIVEIDLKDATIYYVEGGHTFAFADEVIELSK